MPIWSTANAPATPTWTTAADVATPTWTDQTMTGTANLDWEMPRKFIRNMFWAQVRDMIWFNNIDIIRELE